MIATLVAGLALAFPVSCVPADGWAGAKLDAGLPVTAAAWYWPARFPWGKHHRAIVLGPVACKSLATLLTSCDRRAAWPGVHTLAHELAHAWQEDNGLPLGEIEAEERAYTTGPALMARLEFVAGCGPRDRRPT